MAAATSQFVFPILKNADIVLCLQELGIPFAEEDLQKPTPQRMQMVYEAFADILMGYTRETFDANVRACASEVENFVFPASDMVTSAYKQDIYQDSIGLMTFHKQLVLLMTQVSVADFSIRDLIKPDPVRVKKILSAILNFAKFREEQLPVFDKHTIRSEQYEAQHRELVDQVEANRARLTALRVQREQEAPLIAERKEINESLRNDLKNLKRQQSALTNDIDALKREKNVLTEKLTNNEYVLQNTKQDVVKTRARIVTSPEKLKQAISEMSSSLMSEKSSVSSLSQKQRDLQARIDAMSVLEADIQSCIKLMEECEGEATRAEEAARKVGKHREALEGKQLEMKGVDVKEQQLLRQLANAEDKLARVRRTAVSKREAAQKQMVRIREEYNVMAQERAIRMQEMDKKKAMIEQTEKKIADLRASTDGEIAGVLLEYSKLKAHIERYMEEMPLDDGPQRAIV